MKRKGWNGLLLFVAVTVAGCAGVNLYTDKELKNKTGLPIYVAKPYLLVKRTGTDASVNVDVIYLPDLENPIYARQWVGIGKATLTVKATDGKLTEYVVDADSKATEFTEAVTAGLKTIAEAFKIQREAERDRARAAAAWEREDLAAQLETLAHAMTPAKAASAGLEKAAAKDLSDGLKSAAAKLRDPTLSRSEEQVAAALEARLRALDRVKVPDLKRELRRIIARLRAAARVAAAMKSTFELYEFRMKDGQTTLARVDLP